MKIKELITDPVTRQLSHTKLWANIGMAAMTFVFIRMGIDGSMTEGMMLVYGGIFGVSAGASKFLSLKMGHKAEECDDKPSEKPKDK